MIKTFEQFAAIVRPFIEEDMERDSLSQTELQLCCRICGYIDAQGFSEANMREWINLFTDGCKGYHTKKDVVQFLTTIGEGEPDAKGRCFPSEEQVTAIVKEFFGK